MVPRILPSTARPLQDDALKIVMRGGRNFQPVKLRARSCIVCALNSGKLAIQLDGRQRLRSPSGWDGPMSFRQAFSIEALGIVTIILSALLMGWLLFVIAS
jgi:hypothetical protein